MSWSRQAGTNGASARTARFVEAARAVRLEHGWSRGSVAAVAARAFPATMLTEIKIMNLELGRRATLTLDEAMAWAGSLGTTVTVLLGEAI